MKIKSHYLIKKRSEATITLNVLVNSGIKKY